MTIQQPSLCSRCAILGKTCCQGREIYLTPGDRRRISAYAGDLQFAVWTRPLDPAYMDQADDPLWQRHVFCADGSRRTLKTRPNGDCIFLTVQGCRLAPGLRPLLCRLHPFTYTADHLDGEPDSDCPRHLLANGETVFAATGTSRAQAVRWHRQLYAEIRGDTHADWTDAHRLGVRPRARPCP